MSLAKLFMQSKDFINYSILLGIGFITFSNSLYGVYQFDDFNVIVNYAPVHDLKALFKELPRGIRPVLKLTYTLNWISSWGVKGFHWLNISLHLINGILVYLLSKSYLKTSNNGLNIDTEVASLIASLLFILHPLQTESVTYISGRSSSLMSLFYLLSLLFFIRQNKTYKLTGCNGLSILFYLLAIGSKETAIILPVTLVIWLVLVNHISWPEAFRRCRFHWLILSIFAVFVGLHPIWRNHLLFAFNSRSMWENILTQINALAYLIPKILLPWRVNIDPDLPVIHSVDGYLILQLLILFGIFYALFEFGRLRPWWRFGLAWFLLNLVPTNSIIPRLDVVNDRQLYLPLFGFALPMGIEIAYLLNSSVTRRIKYLAAIIILFSLLGFSTFLRNRDYQTEIALWSDTVTKSPVKARPWNNLGVAYERQHMNGLAYQAYVRAFQLDPDYPQAKANLERFNSSEQTQ